MDLLYSGENILSPSPPESPMISSPKHYFFQLSPFLKYIGPFKKNAKGFTFLILSKDFIIEYPAIKPSHLPPPNPTLIITNVSNTVTN